MSLLLTNLKHFGITFLILLTGLVCFGLNIGADAHLFEDKLALLGRWLASKNALEVINGVAFVHGGLHPDLAKYQASVPEINQIVRSGYRSLPYSPVTVSKTSFLQSGPAWYRGYFKDDLTQQAVEQGLTAVGAKAVVVGHTLQSATLCKVRSTPALTTKYLPSTLNTQKTT